MYEIAFRRAGRVLRERIDRIEYQGDLYDSRTRRSDQRHKYRQVKLFLHCITLEDLRYHYSSQDDEYLGLLI